MPYRHRYRQIISTIVLFVIIIVSHKQIFIFNGDIVYGDCKRDGDCAPLYTAWADLFANDHFSRARAEIPMMGVLDDHDYGQGDAPPGDCVVIRRDRISRTSTRTRGIMNESPYSEQNELPQNDAYAANPHKHVAKAEFLRRFGAAPTDPRRRRGGLYTAARFGPAGRRLQARANGHADNQSTAVHCALKWHIQPGVRA